MYKVQNQSEKRMSQLPGWLWPNSNILPPLYKKIWDAVREDKSRPGAILGEVLVDTNKIFPILLTSQLSTEVLGYIWSLANQKYAGQLTEQELYTVLALVALAQASYSFNSLEVLHLVKVPPVPNINLTLLGSYNIHSMKNEPKTHESKVLPVYEIPCSDSSYFSNSYFITNSNSVPSLNSCSSSVPNSNSIPHSNSFSTSNSIPYQRPGIRINSVLSSAIVDNSSHSTHESGLEIKNPPSNCGFGINFPPESRQSGMKNHSSDLNDDFSDFQSAPLPTIPTIPMWDSKKGSAIGSRLANHNLGVKKTSEKFKKGVNKSQSHSGSLGKNSGISLTANKEIYITDGGIPFRNQGKNSILEPVGSSENQFVDGGIQMNSENSNLGYRDGNLDSLSELFPKCSLKNQSKTVILKDTIIRNDPPRCTEIIPQKFPSADDVIGNEPKTIIGTLSLDKFSPPENTQDLMNLQQAEDKYSALRVLVEEPVVTSYSEKNFKSTDPLPADDFGDFVSAEQPPNNTLDQLEITEAKNTETNIDLLSELDLKSDDFLFSDMKAETSLVQEISEAFDALGIEEFREHSLLGSKFEAQFYSENGVPREDCSSVNSIELGSNAPGPLTRSGSVPSLDLKSFFTASHEEGGEAEEEGEIIVENVNQVSFWEWKQYMESCVLLLQVSANIFSNISSESVLREVLATAQGYNFLCNLAEVAAVCRRVNFSHKEMDINIMGFDDLLMDIDKIWAEMEPFYTNIPIVTELPAWPLHQNDNVTCALCLTVITSGKVSNNENNYHVTCANLWLNCINSDLPVLRNPSIRTHSTISNNLSQI